MKNYLLQAIKASIEAGEQIMGIYNDPASDFGIERKADNSPLTKADQASHLVIQKKLKETPYPILSEEGKHFDFAMRKAWETLWIVDPLDGTKEFIKKNGEFTVNIALCVKGAPILGVIYLPVDRKLYFGLQDLGAFCLAHVETDLKLTTLEEVLAHCTPLPLKPKDDIYRIVASRSHQSPETQAYIEKIKEIHPNIELINSGSSIKICKVAEGSAQCYPRFAPTMEWDTAAGDAIARAAGKGIYLTDEQTLLSYNKENLLNPFFIVK